MPLFPLIPPITPVQEHATLADTIEQPLPLWTDLITLDVKYLIAFWFELVLLAYAGFAFLAHQKFRRYLGYKPGWNETDPKIPMVAFDWYNLRSSLAIATHAFYWILFVSVGLKATAAHALAGIPLGLISLHSLLNNLPKDANCTNRADMQGLLMTSTQLFLLCIDSPHLLLAERITSVLTVIAGLQLYLSPALVAWIYNMPRHYAEERVMVHHINYYGYSLLVMETLGSALVWQNPEQDNEKRREKILVALGASLMVFVVGYAPMTKDARHFVTNSVNAYIWMLLAFVVALMILLL